MGVYSTFIVFPDRDTVFARTWQKESFLCRIEKDHIEIHGI